MGRAAPNARYHVMSVCMPRCSWITGGEEPQSDRTAPAKAGQFCVPRLWGDSKQIHGGEPCTGFASYWLETCAARNEDIRPDPA